MSARDRLGAQHDLPLWCVGLQPVPEERLLLAAFGQHGHKASSPGRDVPHRLFGAQLGVGDIDEPGVSDEIDEPVPRGDVGEAVLRVARRAPVRERDRPVGRHREDPQQLLEVGTMVLVVAVGDLRDRLAAARR
jgi:hypothetical protein